MAVSSTISSQLHNLSAADESLLAPAIAQLARAASIEINVQDVKHLDSSRTLLPSAMRVFVSHLPQQSWQDTLAASRAVRAAGFDPIPHIPARLLDSERTFESVLDNLAAAGVQEVLLIAGDYPQPAGPYAEVVQLLRSGLLNKHGFRRVSLAGHPEGHPTVDLATIRRAERDKAKLATEMGLETSLVTQFFFEHQPFVEWVHALRAEGVNARLIGGLAGPASLTTLFKFAVRCGAGPSIRALGARPSSIVKLIGDHGPEAVMRGLAAARVNGGTNFDGVHLFCFGGFLRSCEWLQKVAAGRFKLDQKGGFKV